TLGTARPGGERRPPPRQPQGRGPRGLARVELGGEPLQECRPDRVRLPGAHRQDRQPARGLDLHGGDYIVRPPSTSTVRPLKYSHSRQNFTASQMSSGSPIRPTGIAATRASPALAFIERVMGVSIIPGATAVALAPRGATSRAQVPVFAASAAFAAT